ncbi:MAG: DUF1559 domain-containing protein [Planctomycetia bacterium]|nr:DUF1559 domain-containing protein [Planctomycetia bacterium]
MSVRIIRRAMLLALSAAIGLACLPACKKTKPTESAPPENPNPPGTPPPPGPTSTRDPGAPSSPVFNTTGSAPLRTASAENLKQIGLALHNYHDATGSLPAGYADKTGKPGLSWRVALLPYLEQENLFRQFKTNEPWDSEHNKKLIRMMPKVYMPGTSTNGYTFYRGFTGPGTWLPPQQKGQSPRGVTFGSITDGLSVTTLVAEAYDPVIWTKPDELEFAPNKVPKLGGVYRTGALVLMADGSVKFLRSGFENSTLAKLIQISDGGIVDIDR